MHFKPTAAFGSSRRLTYLHTQFRRFYTFSLSFLICSSTSVHNYVQRDYETGIQFKNHLGVLGFCFQITRFGIPFSLIFRRDEHKDTTIQSFFFNAEIKSIIFGTATIIFGFKMLKGEMRTPKRETKGLETS